VLAASVSPSIDGSVGAHAASEAQLFGIKPFDTLTMAWPPSDCVGGNVGRLSSGATSIRRRSHARAALE